MQVSRNDKIRCGWCYKESTVGEWNDLTYSQCTNREMKRLFQPLMDKRAFNRNSVSFYQCPLCGKWLRGNQLTLIKDSEDKHANDERNTDKTETDRQ